MSSVGAVPKNAKKAKKEQGTQRKPPGRFSERRVYPGVFRVGALRGK